MRLVINIPDEEYKRVMDGKWEGNPLADYIENGVTLPKGHGRLIDEKDLSLMTIHMIDGTLVCDAPTIVKAESEE